MARKDSHCIFCEPDPCSCNTKKKSVDRKHNPPKAARADEPVAAVLKPSVIDAMRREAQESQLADIKRRLDKPRSRSMTELGEEDVPVVQALRALQSAFTVEGPEIDKYKQYLSQPPTVTERATAWRMRRGGDG